MADQFTEITSASWGGRLMSSIKGILLGALLVLVMVLLLWWNEGRAVRTAKSLAEGAGAVVSVGTDKIDPANQGKLVYVTGPAATTETLVDNELGVSAVALRLNRAVLIYEWKETATSSTERNLGGSSTTKTTYDYQQTWLPDLIESSKFHHPEGHDNPATTLFSGTTTDAQAAAVGAFKLSPQLLDMIGQFEALPVSPQPRDHLPNVPDLKPLDGGYYLGADPAKPQVGDLKITFRVVKSPQVVSIIARQDGSGFAPYQTRAGDSIRILKVGQIPARDLFAQAQAANARLTWLLRIVGLMVMWIGFAMIISPLAVLADVLPFLGDLVRLGAGLLAGAAAIGLSLVVIAVAWLFYRPVLAIVLLLIAAGAVFGIVRVIKSRNPAAAATGQA